MALAIFEPLSVAALFVFMLVKSWLSWSDPLIDFSRDLYLAWRVSEGDLLYDKVTNWYGPLANLAQGAGFRVFGAGYDTMIWMDIVLAAVVLLLLRGIFGMLGNRLMVWLASVVFVAVFMVGQYSPNANYNFITPYAVESVYCFAGLLLTLWGLLKHLRSRRPVWLAVAGLGFAVGYLDKPEAILAGGAALGLYFFAQGLRRWRAGEPVVRWLFHSLGWLLGGFLVLWVPVFVYFWTRGGFGFALRATDFAVVSVMDASIRQAILVSPVMQEYSGFDHFWPNFFIELKVGAGMAGVCGVVILAGRAWHRVRVLGVLWWVLPLVVAGTLVGGIWLAKLVNVEFAREFVFPVCLAALVCTGWSLRAAWKEGAGFERALGLAVVGVAASLMMTRIILNAKFGHYGFFMMPLAALFWFELVVVEAARPAAGRGPGCWLVAAAFAAVLLTGAVHTGNNNLKVYALKTYPVGEGRDRFYSVPPEDYLNGVLLNKMIVWVRKIRPNAKSLVVFPEGAALNYHLRVPTPLKELEFHPIALAYAGPQHVLDELKAHPPEVVVLVMNDFSSYGVPYFGADEASGRNIVLWLNEHYSVAVKIGHSSQTITGDAIDLLVPKTPNDHLAALLP